MLNRLEKRVDELDGLDCVAIVLRLVIQGLQMVMDFRGNETEVGMIHHGGRLHFLNDTAIETNVIAISKTD